MKKIKIGLCYDTAEDYGFNYRDKNYTDFADHITASEIIRAIEFNGYEAQIIGSCENLNKLILEKRMDCDLIFNIAEGFNSRNREGLIPGLLEVNGIKHTASDSYSMSLTLNKLHTKLIAKLLNVNTPNFLYVDRHTNLTELAKKFNLNFPVVIKPNAEGGSMGVQISSNIADAISKIKDSLLKYPQGILCEEYIDGYEVTIPMIGNGTDVEVLGVVTITGQSKKDFFIYDNLMKLEDDNSIETYCTLKNNFSPETINILKKGSLDLYKHLDLFDYARLDYRVSRDGKPFFLEINPMPALNRNDSFELCMRGIGKDYNDLIRIIITNALTRFNQL